MKKKYPISLFIMGFALNFFTRYFFLLFPAVILLVVGIWVKVCRYIGLALLLLNLILSLVGQLILRSTALHSDDPDFAEFQDAILSDDWKDNVKDIVNSKIDGNDKS